MTDFKDYINHFMKIKNLKAVDIEKKTGIGKANISKYLKGPTQPTPAILGLLEKEFGVTLAEFEANHKSSNDYSKEKQLNYPARPLYDIEAYGGFNSIISEMTINVQPSSYINVPYLNHCELFIRFSGDSMYPKICHGDILAIRRIKDIQNFVYGEIYVLVTKGNHQMTTKYVQSDPNNPDNVLLVAYNKSAGSPQSLPKEEILEIWEYLGKISV